MTEDVSALFDDYAARFVRGERPDARDYLRRAGEGVGELGMLIERFLEHVPPPPPDDDALRLAEAWVAGHSPLVDLRASRGITRDEAVDALIKRLGLDRSKRAKVQGYYHQLENGLLDVRRVDPRVFEVLAARLKARVGDLLAWRPRPLAFEGTAYHRVAPAPGQPAPAPATASFDMALAPEEPDEIDRLFRGDPRER